MDLPESTPAQTPPPPPAASAADLDKQDIEQNKDIAAFSYLWIMSIAVFFLRRKSPFAQFHAKQAMILFALSIAAYMVPVISKLLELGILGLMVLGFINAAQGQRKDIPLIGPLSRREITLRQAWQQIVDAVAKLVKYIRPEKKAPTAPTPASPPPASPSAPAAPVPSEPSPPATPVSEQSPPSPSIPS